MNTPARSLRFASPEELNVPASAYWRTRSQEERLRETLKLHREGNALFKGGNPAFAYVIEIHHIPARQDPTQARPPQTSHRASGHSQKLSHGTAG